MNRIAAFIAPLVFSLVLLGACSKSEDDPGSGSGGNGGGTGTQVSVTDSLSRAWVVWEAYHQGSPDHSSAGLRFEMYSDGSYYLEDNQYTGTWRVLDNKTQVILDEGNSQYETTWTLVKLGSEETEITFKSPFTGGDSRWILRAR